MLGELIWSSIGAIVLLFCIAWLFGAIALAWWFWKHRDKTWEDDIDWNYGNYVIIQKEAA